MLLDSLIQAFGEPTLTYLDEDEDTVYIFKVMPGFEVTYFGPDSFCGEYCRLECTPEPGCTVTYTPGSTLVYLRHSSMYLHKRDDLLLVQTSGRLGCLGFLTSDLVTVVQKFGDTYLIRFKYPLEFDLRTLTTNKEVLNFFSKNEFLTIE